MSAPLGRRARELREKRQAVLADALLLDVLEQLGMHDVVRSYFRIAEWEGLTDAFESGTKSEGHQPKHS